MLDVTDASFRTAGSTVLLVFAVSYSLTYSFVEVSRSNALLGLLSSNVLVTSHMCACEMLNRKQAKYTVETFVSIKVILIKNVLIMAFMASTAIAINGGGFNRFVLGII